MVSSYQAAMIKRMLLAHGDDVAGAAAVLLYSRRFGSDQVTTSLFAVGCDQVANSAL